MRCQRSPDCERRVAHGVERADGEPLRGPAYERELVARNPRDEKSRQHGEPRLCSPPDDAACRLNCQGNQCEQTGAGEKRPTHEEQPPACVTPAEHEPADGERPIENGGALGVVPEREDRCGECDGQSDPRIEPGSKAGPECDCHDEGRRPEREQRRSERGGRDSKTYRSKPLGKEMRGRADGL